MKMRKTMWAVCLAALMPISAEAVAATSYDEPQQKENTQKKEIPNPEKTARRRTDEMDKVLNLTEKQYKKIYKLNLKEEGKTGGPDRPWGKGHEPSSNERRRTSPDDEWWRSASNDGRRQTSYDDTTSRR